MKQSFLIALVCLLLCALTLSSCGEGGASQTNNATAPGNTETKAEAGTVETKENKIEAHTHAFGAWTVITEADCLTKGEQECSCTCSEKEKQEINALGHSEVIDPAVSSTCTVTGKTEGKHCSRCKHILVEQTAVPLTNHSYDNDNDEKCNLCNFVRDVSCKHPQTPPLPAVAATCTTDGKTEGKKCASCQETLVAQTTVNALGHSYHSVVTPPTKTESGYTTHTCSGCGDTYTDSITPATDSLGLTYTVNSDGKTCTIIGMGTCTDTEVYIPEKMYYGYYTVTAIGEYAFRGCTSLASVNIPDSVTSIGNFALENCKKLTSLTIPNAITYIGDGAVHNCASLILIQFKGTKAQWEAVYKGNEWDDNTGEYIIHCTDGDIARS